MIDWGSDDYALEECGKFITPGPEAGTGIYLLDESSQATDPSTRPGVRVPIRRYPEDPTRPRGGPVSQGRPGREGFYGNIISDRSNNRAIFNTAWDERPLHYSPHAGSDWAHLVPPASRRPYGGGWAPSQAFPLTTQSEAANNPNAISYPSTPSRECQPCAGPTKEGLLGGPWAASPNAAPDPASICGLPAAHVAVFLLVVVVALLAMALSAVGRLARDLDSTVRMAVATALAFAPQSGRP